MIQLILLILLLSSCSVSVRAESNRIELDHGDHERGFYLYVPASLDVNTTAPLVVALHGRGSDGTRMEALSELNDRADQYEFVVAYPDARGGTWFYPRGLGGFGEEPDDTAFLIAVIDKLVDEQGVDARRIYVTGISNGGFMAQRLACDAPDRIAAIASVAATGFAEMELACNKDTPVAAMFVHGTEDQLVPWKGRVIKNTDGSIQTVTYPMSKTLNLWSAYNGCEGNLSQGEIPTSGKSPGTRVTIIATDPCRRGSEVVLFSVLGGGHNWPGVRDVIPERIAGRVNMDFHASDEIVKFFQRHAKPTQMIE